MKNTLFAKLIAVLVVVCATIFVVTACDFGFGEGESSSSVSSFYEQGESTSFEDSSSLEDSSISEDSSSEDSSSAGDSSISQDSSSEDSTSAEDSSGGEDEGENGLEFSTVQIENNVGSISVSNATEKFSFADEITVIGNAKYVVSLDEYGINTSLTKVVPLTVGDNLFYIFEMVNDEIQNTYLITVRRRPIYTVSFNTDGGTAIQSQRVEEGALATLPEEIPTRNGYEFASWAFDFALPIMQTTSISANWSAVTYSITYDLAGGVIEQANPNEYTIESQFTLTAPTREGYEFLGWYDGEVNIPKIQNTTGNKTLTAKWESIFNYSNGVITGLKSKYQNLTQIVIPEEINGEAITSIGYCAFEDCESLTSVVIGDSVTSIGDYAFYYCISLTSVVIPDSVISIGDSAFYNCISLTSIVIPDSVTLIGNSAFASCSSLTSIVIPDSVTSIGAWVFSNCESLQYNVKDNLNYLGNETNPYLYLSGVTSQDITSANIDNSCKFIGSSAFRGCSSLTSIVIPDSVTLIGNSAFASCSSLTSIVIPDSVTSIGDWAFASCSSLTSIVIPDSVTSIGAWVFSNCESLTSVVIGDSVTSIGDYVFEYCSSLTSIVILDSVTSIGDSAFHGCSSLTSIVIPDSVTSIGDWAFANCESLTSVVIGDSVTSIGDYAFYYCISLTSVVIPDSVISIGDSAFYNCISLTSIVIPDSVTSIGYRAFYSCESLTSIKYRGSEEEWNAISKGSNWDYNTGNYTIVYNYTSE